MPLRRGAVEFIRTSRPARTCRANVGQHRGVHRHIQHEPVDTSDLAWFPAWALIRKTRLARWPRLAQPSRPLAPERAMLPVFDLLNLKRQGRHHDLVERRKDLRDPSPRFMRCTCAPASDASAHTGKISRLFRLQPRTRPSAYPESPPPAQQPRPLILRERSPHRPGCA